MSPWRQLWPSILEIDAMFPAPNAETCVGSSTMIAIATSSTYCDETPMVVWRARSGWWGDVEGSKSRDDARKTWTRAVIACITGLKGVI
jgi:hypothetical protein